MRKMKREESRKGKEGGFLRMTFVKRWAIVLIAVAIGLSLPCGETQGASPPFRIGAVYDLTGGLASYGMGSSMTAKAAIERINKAGGIAGRQVEYIVEDGGTDAATGLRKMRKLVLKDECDFILLSCNSALGVGAVPLAKELDTIIFSEGTAREITGVKGNRYVFRQINNAEMAVIAMARFAAKDLGKNAYGMGNDYEWGHSVVDTAEKNFAPFGVKMTGKSFAPIGTIDFVPYLVKIPKETNFIVAAFLPADFSKLTTQAYELGLRIPIFAGTIANLRYSDLGPGADLIWCGTYGSRTLEGFPPEVRSSQKAYRDAVGLSDDGWHKDGKLTAEYIWAGWEGVSWIKKGVEDGGWKSKKDNMKFIKALEGAKVKASLDFPTGGKSMRAEDHQVMGDTYVIKAEKGGTVTKACIRGEEILPLYPPNVDYRKEQ